jgi:hypothetical protein
MVREKRKRFQWPKVPMRRRGVGCRSSYEAAAMVWSEGSGPPPLGRVNRQRDEPYIQRKAAAFERWHEPDKSSARRAICPCFTRSSCASRG